SEITELSARYPSITIDAAHTVSYLTVKTWDGSSTIATIGCVDGVPGEALPAVPARESTAQYDYTGVGYSRSMDSETAEADAATNVMADRTIYAAYSRAVRSYTITWKNDASTTLRTDTLAYGAMPSWGQAMPTKDDQTATGWTPEITTVTGPATYTASYLPTWTATFKLAAEDGGITVKTQTDVIDGTTPTPPSTTPTSSRGSDYTFTGWSPTVGPIHADTTYTAVFSSPVTEIEDDWATIIAKIDAGTADYKIGNYKELDLGAQGKVHMQIAARGEDGTTYSFVSMETLKDTHRWNPDRAGSSGNYTEGTGTIGGWAKSELRTYLKETIKPLIPQVVREAIKEVKKYSYGYNTSGSSVNNMESTEDVWIPSYREVGFGNYETSGPIYSVLFPDNASRVKKNVSTGSAAWWWLRSAGNNFNAYSVYTGGSYDYYNVNNSSGGVVVGFCL
ncbi:MAG: DUF6273 domain-containing protein, partial [bacterium]